MLTIQERQQLYSSVDAAVRTVNRMKKVIIKIAEKKHSVKQILIAQKSIDDTTAEMYISALIELTEPLNNFIDNLSKIVEIEDDITDVFKTYIQKEFILFAWDNVSLTRQSSVDTILNFLEKQTSEVLNVTSQDSRSIEWLCNIFTDYPKHLSLFERKVATYNIFDKIKWINNHIVLIGANGSGKSTFSRQLSGKLSSNISILSAQHLLVYTRKDSIPASSGEINKLRTFQKDTKMSSDTNFASLIGDDMNKLITALIAEHTDKALAYYNGTTREKSFLETTIEIWHDLIEHRSLAIGRGTIFAQLLDGTTYPFNSLSDGEKAVFYYVGHVLLIEPNSYIIVDEPENHLHMAICSKLWDKLEQIRPDCKFIYLTHSLDFASSRNNITLIWNKNFTPPDIWDFEIIESDETLPDSLLMEVLGSRKQICFCEGKDKSSLDYKLYSVLFPEYTVIPVGGHLDVISYTNAYNKSSVCVNDAIGIIDGDCHKAEQIIKWQEQNVYTIPVNEIENILCDSFIIESASVAFLSRQGSKEAYYSLFWQELEREKEQQTVWYVNNIINNKFKENFLHEKRNIDDLKTELLAVTSEDEINNLYSERLQTIELLIRERNYESALTIVNFKGKLINHIAKKIVDDYSSRVIELIRNTDVLKNELKKKYLGMLP